VTELGSEPELNLLNLNHVQVVVRQILELNIEVQVQVPARIARTWTRPDSGQSNGRRYFHEASTTCSTQETMYVSRTGPFTLIFPLFSII